MVKFETKLDALARDGARPAPFEAEPRRPGPYPQDSQVGREGGRGLGESILITPVISGLETCAMRGPVARVPTMPKT
jgi:hypothetical protein